MERILLRHIDSPDSATYSGYVAAGGYGALKKARTRAPQEIVDEVVRSGLRGRGGAGFPTGQKWKFALASKNPSRVLICNADEGEPGTFKDRSILEKNPHLLLEGMAIASHTLGAEDGFIYLRREYPQALEILERAIAEAYEHDVLGEEARFELSVFVGAGAYICGEETALIESLEGKRGQPRSKPPYPVAVGAWGRPTVVNNVETLANIPYIAERGGDAFAAIGSPNSPGPKLFSVSGSVRRPGVVELPMGVSLRELIDKHAGGPKEGRIVKAVIPGGVSTPVIPAQKLDAALDFDGMAEAGSMLGSGAVIVLDDTVCMVKVARRAMQFFAHESCGKCVPCREGTGWLVRIVQRIERGDGRAADLARLAEVCSAVRGTTFCPLGESAATILPPMLEHFEDEFAWHIENGGCTESCWRMGESR